ncbi:MAG: hypothetical protein J6K66_01005 [Clostridia bacterium]|nr:hypothetical protein [Clostridia bacterium]
MPIRIVYRDVALETDDKATVTASTATGFSDKAKIISGVETPAIATFEPNGWGLSHDYQTRKNQQFAFWSVTLSDAQCIFANPPTITVSFTEQYTATGLSIRFAPNSGDYCKKINVVWYQGTTVKYTQTYTADTTNFVINQTVEAFDKIVFVFSETGLPRKRCKIEQILIGVIREFDAKEIKSFSSIHEVSLVSETIPINIMDAGIHSADNIDYIFQRKQEVKAYDGESLIGTYYIEKSKKLGSVDYTLSCQDAVGLLEKQLQPGGLWLTDTALTTILSDIFGDTAIFNIDSAYSDSTLRGYIEPNTTKRAALQQIAFALGAVVDTSGTDKIKIFPPPVDYSASISTAKTYTGGNVEKSDTVTEVTVTAYIISDERPGDNDESIEYNGVKYKYYTDTKHALNPNTVSSDPENKKKFDKMYLCNLSNAQTLANNIMSYYQRRDKYNFRHVLDSQELSRKYSVKLPWGDLSSGNIIKMSVITSGITASDTEMLLDE